MAFRNEAIYSIYAPEKGENPLENLQVVSDKFSFAAFIFTIFWALYNKLWLSAFILFFIACILAGFHAQGQISEVEMTLLRFGIALCVGFEAHNLIAFNLERKGYVLMDVVLAQSPLEAQSRYLERIGQQHNNYTLTEKGRAITKPRHFRPFSRAQ